MTSAPPPPSILSLPVPPVMTFAAAGRDDIGERRARDREHRTERRRVQVLEIGDGDLITRRLVDIGRDGEINPGGAAGRRQYQRVGAGPAVDGGFGALIDDGVVA